MFNPVKAIRAKLTEDYTRARKLGALLILVGSTLIIIMLGLKADYTARQMRIYCALGAVLTALGLYALIRYKKAAKAHVMDFSPECAIEDKSKLTIAPELTEFRADYAAFFAEEGIKENSPVQNDTTQLFKNVLDLHKRRLDRLGLKMEFRSVRKAYTPDPVREEFEFDGKYSITDFDEQIEAKRRFTAGKDTLFLRTSNQIAHYSVVHARHVDGSDTVICPSCGKDSTRENLIDGCDYCGTRFTVEDLGSKVASFSFRDNYAIAHARYKSLRSGYTARALWIIFFLLYFLCMFVFSVVLFDDPGEGEVMSPFFWTFSFMGISGCFAFVFGMPLALAYVTVVLPLLNIGASFKYNSKRKLRALREAEEADKAFAERVRAVDPLFSATDFISNIQNKLSTVIFAEDAVRINTFALTDLSRFLPDYRDVFDYDIDKVTFEDLSEADGLRRISLTAQVRLFSKEGGKIKNRRENIRMELVRSVSCNTRAVCAPSVLRCNSCGSSLSFSEGLVCRYCGRRADLIRYDWMIASFEK